MINNKIKKGDIYLADMRGMTGSEQSGIRPVLILQNNKGNKYSHTTIVTCLTTKIDTKAKLPTHYLLSENTGLQYRSMVMLEQIFTIDKSKLMKRIGKVSNFDIRCVETRALRSLDIKLRPRRRTHTRMYK